MVKAAWQNLVTGLADPDQNLGTLVGNFTDSIVVAGNNLIPRIQELLPRIVEAISALMGTVSTQLPGILGSTLPSLIEGASNLVTGLMSALPEILTVLGDIAPTAIGILGSGHSRASAGNHSNRYRCYYLSGTRHYGDASGIDPGGNRSNHQNR